MKEEAVILFLKQDNLSAIAGLAALVVIAWTELLYIGSVIMPQPVQWGLIFTATVYIMWTVMMFAMMIPSATPMILVFSAVNKKRTQKVPTWIFLLGYLAVWSLFALLATTAQFILSNLMLLSDFILVNRFVSGSVLVAAGIYQFTPVKDICLKNCQSPLGFIMDHWRDGKRGAFIMGLKHGVYCVGCCWILMGLLFVLGIMNIFWIAALAIFILLEKLVPFRWLTWVVGLVFVLWGAGLVGGLIF